MKKPSSLYVSKHHPEYLFYYYDTDCFTMTSYNLRSRESTVFPEIYPSSPISHLFDCAPCTHRHFFRMLLTFMEGNKNETL